VLLHGLAFCFPECLERELLPRLKHIQSPDQMPLNSRRLPLGLLMISRGELTAEQLRQALELQKRKRTERIGDCLLQLGYARKQTISAALARQWSCPVIKTIPLGVGGCTIPFHLLRKFHMVPVHFSNDHRVLHLAFAERIEYRALFAIEQVLGCKTEACLATREQVEAALDYTEAQTSRGETLFEDITGPEQMTRIVSSYISMMHATEIRVTSCGNLFWIRIFGRDLSADLLFSRTAERDSSFTEEISPDSRVLQSFQEQRRTLGQI
jgi:hypothetical protein